MIKPRTRKHFVVFRFDLGVKRKKENGHCVVQLGLGEAAGFLWSKRPLCTSLEFRDVERDGRGEQECLRCWPRLGERTRRC